MLLHKFLIATLLLSGCIPIAGFGQDHFIYTRYTRDNGLASNEIHSIYQDGRGFLWIGTANGLNLYDGGRFHHYAGRQQGQLPARTVYQVMEDHDGAFWVNMGSEVGIFHSDTYAFDPAPIRTIRPMPKDYQLKLWVDSKGRLLLIVTGFGVFAYNKASHCFTPEGLPFPIPDNFIPYEIFEDRRTGNYWMTSSSGLAMYDVHRKELFSNAHNPQHLALFDVKSLDPMINTFFIDSKGRCWVVSWTKDGAQHLYLYDSASNHLVEKLPFHGSTTGYREYARFTEQKNGTLWMSGSGSFYRLGIKDQQFRNHRNRDMGSQDIVYDDVHGVIEDKEENLWIATNKGLYVLTAVSQRVLNYAFMEKQDMEINALVQLNDRSILAGTWGQGILNLDSSYRPFKDPFYAPDDRDSQTKLIWDLCLRKGSGQVWAACQRGSLAIYDKQRGQRTFMSPAVFSGSTIRQIEEDQDGHLWFGTNSGRLVKWSASRRYPDTADLKLVKDFHVIINHLFVDKAGLLWIATNGEGVLVIDPKTDSIIRHYQHNGDPDRSLSGNGVVAIQQLNDSIFATGSEALDLINIKTGQVRSITQQNGLPFSRIKTMQSDGLGSLWITSPDNIYRYNYARNGFSMFGKTEGFANADGVGNVAYRTTEGRIMFGGTNNYLLFHPKDMVIKDTQPDVTIGWLYLLGRYPSMDSLNRLKEVTLDHDVNSFTIYFSTTSFLHRNKLNYFYKLEGIDKDWIDADRLLASNYNLLPPGHYTFMVRSVSDEGIASTNTSKLSFFIRPPFWRTWWFLLVVVLIIAGLVYYVYRLRINKLMAIQKIRAKVARDLHDDVGATLTTIGILSEMAKLRTNGNAEARELIEKIGDNSSRMMESMDDIVWSINPRNDSMQRIAARMREYAVTLLEAKQIEYRFHVQPDIMQLSLDMETRRDLFLVFKESVNNLVKYSQCDVADIHIYKENGMLKMKVEDNGVGFDMLRGRKGNGHINIRKRASRMKGSVDIHSADKKGTKVLLEIPITRS